MARLALTALVLVLSIGCFDNPRETIAPALADRVRAAVAPTLVPVARPPIGTATDGSDIGAELDYAAACALLPSLPPELDEKRRVEHGRFGGDRPLPLEVRAALAQPAALAVVAAVTRGVARRYASSPFALSARPGQRPGDYIAVADIAVMAARAAAEDGALEDAALRLTILARMGQDLRHHANLAGHLVGAAIEGRAARAFTALFAGAPDKLAAMTGVRVQLARVAIDSPTLDQALIDEARFRVALAAIAGGLPLGIAWSTNSSAQMIAPWREAAGGAPGVVERSLAELDAYRELGALDADADLVAAGRAACDRAWPIAASPCAELVEPLTRLAAERATLLELTGLLAAAAEVR